MDLSVQIYKASEAFPKGEEYGLKSQLRRASVSVPSNIAEGWGRNSKGSLALFCDYARGSVCELQTQVEIAMRLRYLSEDTASSLDSAYDELNAAIFRFIDSIGVRCIKESRTRYGEQIDETWFTEIELELMYEPPT